MFQSFDILFAFFENNFLKDYCIFLGNYFLFSDHLFSPFFFFWYEAFIAFFTILNCFITTLIKHFDLWLETMWVFLVIYHFSFLHPYFYDNDLDFETETFQDYELSEYMEMDIDDEFYTCSPEDRSEIAFVEFDDDLDFWICEEIIYSDWLVFEYLDCHEYDFWDDESFTLLEQKHASSFFGEDWINFQKNVALLDGVDSRELILSDKLSNEEYLKYYEKLI